MAQSQVTRGLSRLTWNVGAAVQGFAEATSLLVLGSGIEHQRLSGKRADASQGLRSLSSAVGMRLL